jgi:SAM-dependent methyltransferase
MLSGKVGYTGQPLSRLMKIAYRMGLNRVAWSLRRLHCPVVKDALVLEVGSGGNPYSRADILLDAYEETQERHWEPLVSDRPTILAMGEKLPFKDKAFDFVIASHVLEHIASPEKFLAELERVSHAGYIETPDAFMERINPYKDHRLEVTVREDTLFIRKKTKWVLDDELVELYEHQAKPVVTKELIPRFPERFHVRFYWEENIKFSIVNPNDDANWTPVFHNNTATHQNLFNWKAKVRAMINGAVRIWSPTAHNSRVNLIDLLQCPTCFADNFQELDGCVKCLGCGKEYSHKGNLYLMSIGNNNA